VLKVERIIFELANTLHVRLSCSEMTKLQTTDTRTHTFSAASITALSKQEALQRVQTYRHTGLQLCKTVYTEAFNFKSQIPLYVWEKTAALHFKNRMKEQSI
jgi:hypothetical protein